MTASLPSSFPTPPTTPTLPNTAVKLTPLNATITLLDSLVSFYRDERMWVYHTRASLEEALEEEQEASSSNPPTPSKSGQTLSISQSESSPDSASTRSASPISSPNQSSSRWLRRKRGFKLRLDGIRRKIPSPITSRAQASPSGEHILEQFEKMMEARMESCERVNRLVRNANRAHFYR